MKKKILALAFACVMLAGCASTPTNNSTASNNTSSNSVVSGDKTAAKTNNLYIGYGRQNYLYGWEEPDSYVVNGKGEKIIDFSQNYKSVVEYDGKYYAVERIVGSVNLNPELDYYEYDYNFNIYDENGAFIASMENLNFAQYMSDGRFYAYSNPDKQYQIINPFTNETEVTDDIQLIYSNEKLVGIMYMDDDYNIVGVSDLNGENYVEITGYGYAYPVSTDDNTFLVCQKADGKDSVIYENRKMNVLTYKGELAVEGDFKDVYADQKHLFAYDGNVTVIIDGETGEKIHEINGKATRYFDNGSCIIMEENAETGNYIYSLVSKDGEGLSAGWDGFESTYGSDDYGYYIFDKDCGDYRYEYYVVNRDGKVVAEAKSDKQAWISAICEKGFVMSEYNNEDYLTSYKAYDYAGNEIDLGKNYISLERQYNCGGYGDFFIGIYENNVGAGNFYDILDLNFNIVYSGFNSIYPYGNGGKIGNVISVSKGFDVGLFDLNTGEWIYKERCFNALDD